MDENLRWLLNWFYSKCNGQWESQEVLSIGTLDNPGWSLGIKNISEIESRDEPFKVTKIERFEHDWVYAGINEGEFQGCGGPFNLPEVLQIFRDWIEGDERGAVISPENSKLARTGFKSQVLQINTAHDTQVYHLKCLKDSILERKFIFLIKIKPKKF